jgi:TolB-like protein/TolA-binding protein
MKRFICSSILSLVIIAGVCVSPDAADFKRTKIAVLDFQLQGMRQDSSDMGKIVAEWLITALVKEGRFDVIERRLLEKVLEEQRIGISGLVDENSASKLGKVLGAKIVITGSVMQFQNVMEVNARIIEVESSSIIAAENVKSTSAVKLEDLVVQMADKIIRDFPLEGYIVQREEDSVLIDLGKRTGVKKGMQFIVFKEGRVIKHPKTGEVLDIERIETGTIEIKDVRTKTANGVILNETIPDAIESGQMVKSNVELATLDTGALPEEPKKKKREREPRNREAAASDGDLISRMGALDAQIADVKQLKDNGNSDWKDKFKEVMSSIKAMEETYKKAPEVELAYAKAYYAADKLSDSEKYLKKAISLRPQYGEAYVLKGDIASDAVRKMKPKKRRKKGYGRKARKEYESALRIVQDSDLQAMVYYKLGNVYADLDDDRDTAKEFWQKAVNTAPGSEGARLSRVRM